MPSLNPNKKPSLSPFTSSPSLLPSITPTTLSPTSFIGCPCECKGRLTSLTLLNLSPPPLNQNQNNTNNNNNTFTLILDSSNNILFLSFVKYHSIFIMSTNTFNGGTLSSFIQIFINNSTNSFIYNTFCNNPYDIIINQYIISSLSSINNFKFKIIDGYTRNGKMCKYNSTCTPTSIPTIQPIISLITTNNPTPTPTYSPTPSPTVAPSNQPTSLGNNSCPKALDICILLNSSSTIDKFNDFNILKKYLPTIFLNNTFILNNNNKLCIIKFATIITIELPFININNSINNITVNELSELILNISYNNGGFTSF